MKICYHGSEVYMKKIILGLLLTLFLFTGCSSSKLTTLSLEELNEKLTKKETFIVYFSKDDSNLEETLSKVLEDNNLEGYKVDTSDISDTEKNKLELQISYEEPSIVFVIAGKDPSKLSHVTNESATSKDIITRLKDMKFIKE